MGIDRSERSFFKDTLYVEELVAADVVNTMPEKTMEATFEHGTIRGDTVTGNYANANAVLDEIADLGISYDEVTALLEREGIDKFTVSWNELLDTVSAALDAARVLADEIAAVVHRGTDTDAG